MDTGGCAITDQAELQNRHAYENYFNIPEKMGIYCTAANKARLSAGYGACSTLDKGRISGNIRARQAGTW